MKIATIYPDRITIRDPHQLPNYWDLWDNKIQKEGREMSPNSLENLAVKKKSINLSPASQKKIKDCFSLLYHLATPRTVKVNNQKYIYNFRLSFVTLTLPSKQVHQDTVIKKVCLNNFLNTMRQRFGLKNYIWVSELQDNGNIHFHLIFDKFIHHQAVRYYWNKSTELLGYVTEYSNKMSQLSLSEYAALRGKTVKDVGNQFAVSCRSGWNNPPTEQVKTIFNEKNLVAYLSKYITKKAGEETEEERERAETWGKSWGRSTSLSKIRFITHFCWDSIRSALSRVADISKFSVHRVYDYCEVIYFNMRQASPAFLSWLARKMAELGKTYNFKPSPV